MSAPTTSVQHCTDDSIHCNKELKEIKGIYIKKEDVKLSSFPNNIMLYVKKPWNKKKTTHTYKNSYIELISSEGHQIQDNIKINCVFKYQQWEIQKLKTQFLGLNKIK